LPYFEWSLKTPSSFEGILNARIRAIMNDDVDAINVLELSISQSLAKVWKDIPGNK
jgi:hypothetical protein